GAMSSPGIVGGCLRRLWGLSHLAHSGDPRAGLYCWGRTEKPYVPMEHRTVAVSEKTVDRDPRALAIELNNSAADILSRLSPDTRVSADDMEARSTFAVAESLRSIAVSLVRIGDLLEAQPTARRNGWSGRRRRRTP